MARGLPTPLVQALVVCRQIYEDTRTGELLLIAPFNGLAMRSFPANLQCSVFANVSGGHGRYEMALQLRDSSDEVVWLWQLPGSLDYADPLTPHRLTLHDLVLPLKAPGRYELVVLANGVAMAQHSLWFHLPKDEKAS